MIRRALEWMGWYEWWYVETIAASSRKEGVTERDIPTLYAHEAAGRWEHAGCPVKSVWLWMHPGPFRVKP